MVQRLADPPKVLDESPIEVGKSQKHLDLFNRFRHRPDHNRRDLFWVHLDIFLRDYHAKILYAPLLEEAFFSFGIEVVVTKLL